LLRIRFLALGHPADIRFAHIGIHLHLGQIQRDQKEVRRGKTGGYRLTDFHVACHHDSVHRRSNNRVLQFQVGCIQRRRRLFHLGLSYPHLRFRAFIIRKGNIDIILRNIFLDRQRLHTISFPFPLRQIGFCSRQA